MEPHDLGYDADRVFGLSAVHFASKRNGQTTSNLMHVGCAAPRPTVALLATARPATGHRRSHTDRRAHRSARAWASPDHVSGRPSRSAYWLGSSGSAPSR